MGKSGIARGAVGRRSLAQSPGRGQPSPRPQALLSGTRVGVAGNTAGNAGRRVHFPGGGSDGHGEGVGRSPDSPGRGPTPQVGIMAKSSGRWVRPGVVAGIIAIVLLVMAGAEAMRSTPQQSAVGATGATGATGPAGVSGATGASGVQGPAGGGSVGPARPARPARPGGTARPPGGQGGGGA